MADENEVIHHEQQKPPILALHSTHSEGFKLPGMFNPKIDNSHKIQAHSEQTEITHHHPFTAQTNQKYYFLLF